VLGLDYGTDSVRALVVAADDGEELATAVAPYPRWARGDFCDAAAQRFRQHPRDHLDALTTVVRDVLARLPRRCAITAIGVDTTGSTPVAVDRDGTPLALTPAFARDPDAMFVLWKDHTAVAEAEEFTRRCRSGRQPDYTARVGGSYSAEWFWAKILRVMRGNRRVARAAFSWVEHCDWLPAVLCGATDPLTLRRSRCAAGHKACWHPGHGGLPAAGFLRALDPRLAGLRPRLYRDTWCSDQMAGRLGAVWARRLGLRPGIPVAVGAFDAHLGAVGAGISPGILVKVMGTSTCDMLVTPVETLGDRCLRGICGQVEGSIIPGLVGLEAGQSAFGDIYAWYCRLLGWGEAPDRGVRQTARLPALERAAMTLPPGAGGVRALDWFNGRRTPGANQRLRGCLAGLDLGSTAPAVYRALIEATAFGSRAIADCFTTQGVAVRQVLALGGIASKSPLVMQICADVLGRPIRVVAANQCCALGAAMMAAVAAGHHRDVRQAQMAMGSGIAAEYRPVAARRRAYDRIYADYQRLGAAEEARVRGQGEP
jgi:L-ribulokinase